MARLKMKKPKSLALPDPMGGFAGTALVSRCQIEIPGVGRIRTGERHPDFHFVEEALVQETKPPVETGIKSAIGVR